MREEVKGQQNIFVFKFFLTCLRIHIFISWIYISSWLKNQTVLQENDAWGKMGSNRFYPVFVLSSTSASFLYVFVCDSFNACALPSLTDPQSQWEELWCLRSMVLFTNWIKEENQRQETSEMDPVCTIPVWAVNKERNTSSEQIKIRWNSSF